MNNNNDIMLPEMFKGIQKKTETESILACNEDTKKYGLYLTEQQALALADTREKTLNRTNRVEFGSGITVKLIKAFADSPYISQSNYESILHELTESFYHFKNETHDILSDDELVQFMKNEFNGTCAGSLELLNSRSLAGLAQLINKGGRKPEI